MNKQTSDKLGTAPIPRLLLKMSLPAMLSMLTQALYNVVDTLFIGHIPNIAELADKGEFLSDYAVRALTYAMPFQMLVGAFALGIGIATSSLMSRRLGEGRREEASQTAQTGLFLAIVASVIFIASGYFLADGFMLIFAERDSLVFQMGKDYLAIIMMCSCGLFLEIWLARLLQGIGQMIVPMAAQLVGALTNIALDPIFIFDWGAGLGAGGAAIATVIGQIAAFLFTLTMVLFVKKPEIRFFFTRQFRLKKAILLEIIRVGIPTAVMNAVASFATMAMNGILSALNPLAVNVLGYYFRLQSFVFMPVFGLNQGTLPILAYNYGAGNKTRFLRTYVLCLTIALSIMIVGIVIFLFMGDLLLSIFNASPPSKAIGVPALRIISASFAFAAFTIITTSMFLAIGHGVKSMFMSLARQLIVLVPAALLFANTVGLSAVWWSYPLAEFITAVSFAPIAALTISKIFKKHSHPHDAPPAGELPPLEGRLRDGELG